MFDSLILTYNDWANTGWRMFKCLQHLDLNVMMFKGQIHPFYYPEQAIIHPAIQKAEGNGIVYAVPELQYFAERSRVIHFTSSTCIDTAVDLKEKNVVMQHSGFSYRQNSEMMNEAFNTFVDATIIQMPDILGLGANNETLLYFPVDTDFIQPIYTRKSSKVIIGHFPSQPDNKGSKIIADVIEKLEESDLKNKFIYLGPKDIEDYKKTGVTIWIDHLRRIADCDVIIDVFNDTVLEKPYGEWGNTSFEAAAFGKVVITNSLKIDTYKKEYGDCELIIANNVKQLESVLREVITMDFDQFKDKQTKTRKWVEEKHSIPVTAERLWDKVYKQFF